MGYNTYFEGAFIVEPPMSNETIDQINSINEKRHDPQAVQGSYYCQWIPSGSTVIEYDGEEKFYQAQYWIKYLIEEVLEPAGHKVNGEMECFGEDNGDHWYIEVIDNETYTGNYYSVKDFQTKVE